jgi:integrase|tara:strand:+ start:722 stop:2257 length:1536 start_codon:yes stop_codon:yes gene_type:complete
MKSNIISIESAPAVKRPKVVKGKGEHTFEVNGRNFTIFLKGRYWQINTMINKKLLKRSLKKTNHKAAVAIAEPLIIKALAGCWTEIENKRSRTKYGTTFGQIFAAAPEVSRASAKAVHMYILHSKEALARLFPDRDPETIRLEELPSGAANIVTKRITAEYTSNGNRSRSKEYGSAKEAAVGASRTAGIYCRGFQWLFKSKSGSVRVPLVPEYEAMGLAIPPNILAYLEVDIDRHYSTITYNEIADEIWDRILPGIEEFNTDEWLPRRNRPRKAKRDAAAERFPLTVNRGYGLVQRPGLNGWYAVISKLDGLPTRWNTDSATREEAQAVVEAWLKQGRCLPLNPAAREQSLNFVKAMDLYKMFCAAIGGGLRREEITRLDHDHFVPQENGLHVIGGIGKNGKPINVRIQEHWAAKLRPLIRPGGGLFIDGRDSETYRYHRVVLYLQEWMIEKARPLKWTADKYLHELRAYTGSKIFMRDPFAACEFMRHGDVRITKKFYFRYGKYEPVDVY